MFAHSLCQVRAGFEAELAIGLGLRAPDPEVDGHAVGRGARPGSGQQGGEDRAQPLSGRNLHEVIIIIKNFKVKI